MFDEMKLQIFGEAEQRERIEKHIARTNCEKAGEWDSFSESDFIVYDEKTYTDVVKYLESEKIFYNAEEYHPIREALSRTLKYCNESSEDNWTFDIDPVAGPAPDNITITYKDKYIGSIVFTDEVNGHYGADVQLIWTNERIEKNICETLIDEYGLVFLTQNQKSAVEIDERIHLPNSQVLDLKEYQSIEVDLSSNDLSFFNGQLQRFHDAEEAGVQNITYTHTGYTGYFAQTVSNEGTEIGIASRKSIEKDFDLMRDCIESVKAVDINGKETDLTEIVKAPEPEGYFQRKFHLKYSLPDSNIVYAMINVNAYYESDLPTAEDIRGSFAAEKIKNGWLGKYTPESFIPDMRKDNPNPAGKSDCSLIINGVYRPEKQFVMNLTNTKTAERVYEYNQPIDTGKMKIPYFEGRLEDCIYQSETHYWEYAGAKERNQKLADVKNEYREI